MSCDCVYAVILLILSKKTETQRFSYRKYQRKNRRVRVLLATLVRRFGFLSVAMHRGSESIEALLTFSVSLGGATNWTLFFGWRFFGSRSIYPILLQLRSKYFDMRGSLDSDSHFVAINSNNCHNNVIAQMNAFGFFPGQNQHVEIPFPSLLLVGSMRH